MWRTECLGGAASRSVGAVTGTPEFNVSIFALLLNFAWEILQAPLYAGMGDMPHAQVTRACLQATVGEAVIMLIAYAAIAVVVVVAVAVAVVTRRRRSIVAAGGWELVLLTTIGVAITVAIKCLATHGYWTGNWSYLSTVPLAPGTPVGVAPLLQ